MFFFSPFFSFVLFPLFSFLFFDFCFDILVPQQGEGSPKVLVDFELMKKPTRALKPDATKPVFTSGFTHHYTLPDDIPLKGKSSFRMLGCLSGPYDDVDGDGGVMPGYCAARSLTTYPHFSFNEFREGTPICDFYHYEAYEDCLIVVLADGCNWGLKSWLAARNAVMTFAHEIRENISTDGSAQSVGLELLKALQEAHRNVIAKSHDIWSVGQTTLLGGVLLAKKGDDAGFGKKSDRVFVSLSLGDCKSYYYSSVTKEFEDLSLMYRSDSLDAMDPGLFSLFLFLLPFFLLPFFLLPFFLFRPTKFLLLIHKNLISSNRRSIGTLRARWVT